MASPTLFPHLEDASKVWKDLPRGKEHAKLQPSKHVQLVGEDFAGGYTLAVSEGETRMCCRHTCRGLGGGEGAHQYPLRSA